MIEISSTSEYDLEYGQKYTSIEIYIYWIVIDETILPFNSKSYCHNARIQNLLELLYYNMH